MRTLHLVLALTAAAWLAACSPTDNWRESTDNGAHFVVLLPAKPASVSRRIDLDGVSADMVMTAAEVHGTVFAVGTAGLGDATQARAALDAMRRGLLANIAGKEDTDAALPGATVAFSGHRDLQATGTARGKPMRLVARLAARERRIFQIMILGPADEVTDERIETFFASFKPT